MYHMLTRAGYTVEIVATAKEGLISAWRDLPDIIVMEMDLPDMDSHDLVRKLRSDQRTDRKILVGLTNQSDPDATVSGLEAGLDQYIVKQADAVDLLLSYLYDLQAEKEEIAAPGGIRPGRMLVFLGSRGGVGTSSLCINIANQMASLTPDQSVAAVDLVLPIGSLATMMGIKPKIDLVQLTELSPSELMPDYLLLNLPNPQAWGFYLIPGSENPQHAESLHIDRLAPVIQTLRSTFDFILIDVGRNLSPLAMLTFSQADLLIMILSPDDESIANAITIREHLEREGISEERFVYVTNRPQASESLIGEAVEDLLDAEIDAAVTNFGGDFQLANTLHAPLRLRFPDEMITLNLRQFTQRILDRLKRRKTVGVQNVPQNE